MNDFLKLRYEKTYFDLKLYEPGAKTIVEIFPNGEITIEKYAAGSSKIIKKSSYLAIENRVKAFYEEIRECIDTAKTCHHWFDDSKGTLYIEHASEKVEVVSRGLGNDDNSIYSIVRKFLSHYDDTWGSPWWAKNKA